METDIRWKQRLSNFEKAFKQLESAVAQPSLNTLEEQGHWPLKTT